MKSPTCMNRSCAAKAKTRGGKPGSGCVLLAATATADRSAEPQADVPRSLSAVAGAPVTVDNLSAALAWLKASAAHATARADLAAVRRAGRLAVDTGAGDDCRAHLERLAKLAEEGEERAADTAAQTYREAFGPSLAATR